MFLDWNCVRSSLFAEDSDDWLAILRIGLGVQVAAYCISLRSSWEFLLSNTGSRLIGREVSEAYTTIQSPWIPKVGWILTGAEKLQISEPTALFVIWIVLLLAALCLIAGLFCRPAAVLCWLLHLCVSKSGGLVSYGVDNFMTIGLFYLMLSPLPDHRALDALIWRSRPPRPALLRFFRRVLQIHLCIIYFFGGVAKALGSGWWDGTNLWRALTRPPFDVFSPETIATWQALLPALGICVWVIEIAYPVLIWPNKTRLIWLTLICTMHLGIGFAMGMHLFGVVMIVLNVAAFGPAPPGAKTAAKVAQPLPAN